MSPQSRRDFLSQSGVGFASVALSALLADELRAAAPRAAVVDPLQPLAERVAHFAPKAKQVVFLFQYGGPSTFDLLDYKPQLIKLDGKPVPESFKKTPDKVGGVFNHCKDQLMAGPWKWAQHGQSGQWVSELLPQTARHIDELCQVRSMFSESSNHAPATYLLNTGAILGGKPSLGSWVTYGLGSINQNLPGFVLLYKVGGLGGSQNWSNAFLPAAFQGTQFRHEGSPVLNLQPPSELAGVQRSTLDFAQALNRKHAAERPGVLDLDGRIASYELAYRMQSEAGLMKTPECGRIGIVVKWKNCCAPSCVILDSESNAKERNSGRILEVFSKRRRSRWSARARAILLSRERLKLKCQNRS